MKQTDHDFRIRSYGRQELALCYFPYMTPLSAWRKLKGWILYNPRLRQAFAPDGHMSLRRTLWPSEVALIVEELGEP